MSAWPLREETKATRFPSPPRPPCLEAGSGAQPRLLAGGREAAPACTRRTRGRAQGPSGERHPIPAGGHLARGGGRIINVSSAADIQPLADLTAYITAKGGVVALTKTLALELARVHAALSATTQPQPRRFPSLHSSASRRSAWRRLMNSIPCNISSNGNSPSRTRSRSFPSAHRTGRGTPFQRIPIHSGDTS